MGKESEKKKVCSNFFSLFPFLPTLIVVHHWINKLNGRDYRQRIISLENVILRIIFHFESVIITINATCRQFLPAKFKYLHIYMFWNLLELLSNVLPWWGEYVLSVYFRGLISLGKILHPKIYSSFFPDNAKEKETKTFQCGGGKGKSRWCEENII